MMTYQQAMAATSRDLDIRGTVTLADSTVISLTNAHIMAYSIDEGANEIPLGSAASASYTLELANAQGEWFPGGSIIGIRIITGALVSIEIGVKHDGAFEYKPAGVWYVHKTNGKEGGTRFVLKGNDALISGYNDALDDSGVTYGAATTLNTVLNGIKTAHSLIIGGALVCNGSAIISQRPDWGAACSVRNALAFIAAAGGCSIQVDRSGALQLVPVYNTSTPKAVGTGSYIELENANAYFAFNRIKVMPRGAQADTAYVEGTVNAGLPEAGNNTIVMTDNPIFPHGASNLQAMVDALATALSGYEIDVLTFRHRGDPTIVLSDRVQVTDRRGEIVTTSVLQQSIKYGAGLSSTISSMISLEVMQPSAISRNGTLSPIAFGKGSLDPSVLIAKSITAQYIANKSLTSEEIDVESLEADIAVIVQAKIDTADINWANIKDLVTGTAIITEGVGGKLFINRLAVTEANMVSLTVGELIVKGSDGLFYAVSVDGSGNIVTELKQVGNDDVADASIYGSEKIIEGTITAATLNATDIFANNAIIQQLIAAHLDVDTLFAREGTIEQLRLMDLTSVNDSIRIAVEGLTEQYDTLLGDKVFTDQYIKVGIVGYDENNVPRVGVAIGENLTEVRDANDNLVFQQEHLAQTHTSNRQSFWQNGEEVAYFSNNELVVNDIRAVNTVKIGNWVLEPSNGFSIRWAGE